MPLVFIASIKGDESAVEASSYGKLEIGVLRRISIWNGVIADTSPGSVISVIAAILLVTSTALIFIPSAVIAIIMIALYYIHIPHSYNPLAHRRFAKRRKREWEAELARIQNLDSRIPYKKLSTEP
jgi:hypothetical protein